jgi:hypothetical protein
MMARAGAAVAVFVTLALVLLAGGSSGLLASAEGDTGGAYTPPAQGDGAPPVEEPVLGAEAVDIPAVEEPSAEVPVTETPGAGPPVAEPPPEPPSTEPPAAEEPSPDEPSPDQPSTDERSPAEPSGEERPSGESAPDYGDRGGDDQGDDERGGGEDGGDQGDDGYEQGRSWPGESERQRRTGNAENLAPAPSGGSKGDETASEDPEGEPEPSGRPQVTEPSSNTEPGGTSPAPGSEQSETPTPVGSGTGSLDDSSAGTGGSDANSARFGTAASTGGGDGGASDGEITGTPGAVADATLAAAPGTGGAEAGEPDGAAGGGDRDPGAGGGDNGSAGDEEPNVVTETVDRLVEVVPDSLKVALAALAALSILLGVGYLLAALRARRLARQRGELLQEVGLLQTALLPPVPDRVGALRTSVAYRPADGPGAGGDFYDVLPLAGGRVGFILGDVSGHGRGALARTAFMRYTLRAYLEAGLEPRVALQVAGRVIDDNLGGDFATVLLAVHDPETGSLTYATAGHPAPIVVGPQPHEPVTAGSSPPIGVGVRTGLRQTTVPLVPGSVAALFTDGLMEARTQDGILGRERLAKLLDEIRETASARRLIDRVASVANVRSDDMAAVVVSPTSGVTAGLFRTEQLELSARELEGPIARRFLDACGLSEAEVDDAERDARLLADRFGGVVLHVVFGNRMRVEVLPRNVESIEAASRRVSAESPR